MPGRNTERVLRWRLVIKECGPKLLYIKGELNIVADALSRLALDEDVPPVDVKDMFAMSDNFNNEGTEFPSKHYPLHLSTIHHYIRGCDILVRSAR